MPELPDITVYLEALHTRLLGETLQQIRLINPFLLRTVEPTVENLLGKRVIELRRLGKRVAVGLEGDLWFVIHLMIAGRLHWKPTGSNASADRGGIKATSFVASCCRGIQPEQAGSRRHRGPACDSRRIPRGVDR